jgi:tRNA(Ile)-lysidine synthase
MRLTPLESGIRRVLRDWGTPSAGETVVAALSGGADSVALLDVLASLAAPQGFRVVAAHLDHQLRPGSGEDVAFCVELCGRLGVDLKTGTADVRARAAREGGGLEAAARAERYVFLRMVQRSERAVAIAVAHTRDDQAETVLLRLLRGAGPSGLAGMRPRSGDLIRPLLAFGRGDVLGHLRARGLAWREDPTNADPSLAARNRVRHELIPYLETHFNPRVRETLARTASVLAEEAALETTLAPTPGVEAVGDAAVVSRRGLAAAAPAAARSAVREALARAGGLRGVGLVHVDRIVQLARKDGASGRRVALPGRREAAVHFDEVRIGAASAPAPTFEMPLAVPGSVDLPAGGTLSARPARGPAGARGASVVVAVPGEDLAVRTRRPGDRVRAGGREMSLKRFLMDRRVPAADRAGLPLVAAGPRVVWMPGQALQAGSWPGVRFVCLTHRPSAGSTA